MYVHFSFIFCVDAQNVWLSSDEQKRKNNKNAVVENEIESEAAKFRKCSFFSIYASADERRSPLPISMSACECVCVIIGVSVKC